MSPGSSRFNRNSRRGGTVGREGFDTDVNKQETQVPCMAGVWLVISGMKSIVDWWISGYHYFDTSSYACPPLRYAAIPIYLPPAKSTYQVPILPLSQNGLGGCQNQFSGPIPLFQFISHLFPLHRWRLRGLCFGPGIALTLM